MKINCTLPKKANINMIPLMDSMFLLLVFFIYAMMSMVIQKGLPVTLPEASAAVMKAEEFTIISITKTGNYAVDNLPASLDTLQSTLQNKDQKNILIKADKSAQHGWVISVMDILRQMNIQSISFETLGDGGS